MSKLEYGTITTTIEREQAGETTGTRSDGTSPLSSASGEADDESTVLSKDVIFDILKNRRRRLVLEFLRNRRTTTLSHLAEYVASVENEKAIGLLTSSERKRVYVGLYQCHIPKLSEASVVDYDPERKTVELRGLSSQLYPYLDLDHDGSYVVETSGGGVSDWRSLLASLLRRD